MTDLKALIDAYVDAKIAATNSNVDNWERDKTRLNKAEANLTGYLATLSRRAETTDRIVFRADGWKLVPVDDETREFANSALPVGMIHAGMDVLEKVNEDNVYYTAGGTIDWDNGMVAVAVYRAMLSASPSPPALDGAGRDGIIEECIGALEDAWTQDMSYPEAVRVIQALKETP